MITRADLTHALKTPRTRVTPSLTAKRRHHWEPPTTLPPCNPASDTPASARATADTIDPDSNTTRSGGLNPAVQPVCAYSNPCFAVPLLQFANASDSPSISESVPFHRIAKPRAGNNRHRHARHPAARMTIEAGERVYTQRSRWVSVGQMAQMANQFKMNPITPPPAGVRHGHGRTRPTRRQSHIATATVSPCAAAGDAAVAGSGNPIRIKTSWYAIPVVDDEDQEPPRVLCLSIAGQGWGPHHQPVRLVPCASLSQNGGA